MLAPVLLAGCSQESEPSNEVVSQDRVKQESVTPSKSPETQGDVASLKGWSKSADKADDREDTSNSPVKVGDLVERFDDAVVFIKSQNALGETVSVGTGCVINKSGVIATNRHVIAEAARAVVQFREGEEIPVTGFVSVDEQHDLVLLRSESVPDNMEYFSLVPVELRQGDRLIAIGHPAQFRFTVTEGIVSALRMTEELPVLYQQGLHSNLDTRWVQTTAAISGGSSGGPLMTDEGKLVGLNTWIASGQNLGFAVHVEHLIDLCADDLSEVKPLPLPGTDVLAQVEVARIVNDFQREYRVLLDNLRAASREDYDKIIERQNPFPMYIGRLADYAAENPGTAKEFEALWAACMIFKDARPETLAKFSPVVNRLADSYLQHPRIERVAVSLISAPPVAPVQTLLRDILTKSPHDSARGIACYGLATVLAKSGPDINSLPDVIELLERVVNDYSDVTMEGRKLGDIASSSLFNYKHLTVGQKAVEITGEDFQGELLRLSDHLGKVVVLDFWADWCPHCRVMYPHERELTKRYSPDDFVLLGVNCDERARAQAVIDRGDVTWRSWPDGQQGPIAEQWQIQSIPTIYVLDKNGVIRAKDVRGEELDQSIEMLLEERMLRMPQDMVASGTEWKYSDDGADPGTRWRELEFDDSNWPVGQSPLGYGLGTEATTLDYGNVDQKHVVSYFRKTFQVDDPTKIDRLILGLKADDGAAVYLNGKEIARINLALSATHTSLAFAPASANGEWVSLYVVEPSLLRAGNNVLAAQVHQVSATSADLRFDATLSSRMPEWPPLSEVKSGEVRLRMCRLLGHLGTVAESRKDELKKLLADDYLPVRISAAISLHMIDPEAKIVVPLTWNREELALRADVAARLNEALWPTVCSSDRSKDQLEAAAKYLEIAHRLTPQNGNLCNSLAVAQYRTGQYEASYESVKRAMKIQNDILHDYAIMAMVAHRLGKTEESLAAMEKLRILAKADRWSGDEEAQSFLEEAETLLAAPNDAGL